MRFPLLSPLLERGKKYFQIDVEYFLVSNFWLILSHAITLIKGFVLSIILARLLDQKTFGEYNFLFSIVGVLGIFGLPGMSTAIAHAVAVGGEATYRSASRMILRWSLLGSLCLLILPVFLYDRITVGKIVPFIVLSTIFPFTMYSSTYLWHLGGRGNFRQMMFTNLSYEIIHLAALLTALALTRNALILLIVSLGAQTITYGIYHLRLVSQIPSQPADQDIIAYGKRLTLSSSLSHFKFYGDKILLTLFLDYETLAIYAIASILPGQLYAMGKIIGLSVFPKSAKQSYEILVATLSKKLFYLFLLFLLFSVCLSAIAPIVVPLLFSQKYTTAVWYTQLLSFSILFRSVGIVHQRILESHQVMGAIYVLNIVIPLLEFIAIIVLLPIFGITGLIGAKYLSDITYFLLSAILLYRRNGREQRKIS